jgi:3-O-methylgallate 3,4-dioxygenase
MANLVGCLAMSHAPQLMIAPEKWGVLNTREWDPLPVRPELEKETLAVKQAKWQKCMNAIEVLRQRLQAFAPDVVVVVGDDQHENILDDNTPPFMIYIAEEVEASTSLRYFNEPRTANKTRYRVHADLAKHIVNHLMDLGFDPAYSRKTRYEGGLGHAFARPLKFLMPDPRCSIVPVMVNTYYPPAPSAHRCIQFGKALASALDHFPKTEKVVVVGSGGLSHTKIDEKLDEALIEALKTNDLDYMSRMSSSVLIEGTSEIRNWLVTAACANQEATMVDYLPLYRTITGVGCAMGFAYWQTNNH